MKHCIEKITAMVNHLTTFWKAVKTFVADMGNPPHRRSYKVITEMKINHL